MQIDLIKNFVFCLPRSLSISEPCKQRYKLEIFAFNFYLTFTSCPFSNSNSLSWGVTVALLVCIPEGEKIPVVLRYEVPIF